MDISVSTCSLDKLVGKNRIFVNKGLQRHQVVGGSTTHTPKYDHHFAIKEKLNCKHGKNQDLKIFKILNAEQLPIFQIVQLILNLRFKLTRYMTVTSRTLLIT